MSIRSKKILGVLLIDPSLIPMIESFKSEFKSDFEAKIFESMLVLYDRGETVTADLIADYMEDMGLLTAYKERISIHNLLIGIEEKDVLIVRDFKRSFDCFKEYYFI